VKYYIGKVVQLVAGLFDANSCTCDISFREIKNTLIRKDL